MPLINVDLPSPRALRGGWAAMAAVCASRGLATVFATPDEWLYDDGGGNWVCLRFQTEDRVVLIGSDHEYSDTYFRAAAEYFGEEETDLLADAPDWWAQDLDPFPHGDWVSFIYGWDGQRWQRAAYEKSDGFQKIGLLNGCSFNNTDELAAYAEDAPGLQGRTPEPAALVALVAADAEVTSDLLAAAVPGWDIDAGVAAARKFLEAPLG